MRNNFPFAKGGPSSQMNSVQYIIYQGLAAKSMATTKSAAKLQSRWK